MGASEKGKFKDNGWFVGVTPRRNPEIVVAVLLEEGEHGYFAARAASQVIKAYVEKQRTRETQWPRQAERLGRNRPKLPQSGTTTTPRALTRCKPDVSQFKPTARPSR